jgi:hypothetical protein
MIVSQNYCTVFKTEIMLSQGMGSYYTTFVVLPLCVQGVAERTIKRKNGREEIRASLGVGVLRGQTHLALKPRLPIFYAILSRLFCLCSGFLS